MLCGRIGFLVDLREGRIERIMRLSKRKVKVTGALALMLGVILLTGCGDTPVTPTATRTTVAAVATDTPSTLQPEPQPTLTGGERSVGQTGQVGDVRVTFDEIRRTSHGALEPAQGNEYIVIRLSFENTGSEQVIVGSFADNVDVVDSAGHRYRDTGMANVEGTNLAVEAAYLEPGDKATGEIAFEVPTAANGLVVEYRLITVQGAEPLRLRLDR
jgi:hypothetical protein